MKKLPALLLAALALITSASAETGMGRHRKAYVVPAPGKIVIDGDLGDWDLSSQFEMFVMSETRDQMNAKVALMYDADALYISGVVRDNTPMMNRHDPKVMGDRGWDADSCQIRLSLDPDDGYPIHYTWGGDPKGDRGEGKVALMTLWYFTDEQRPALQICRGMNYKIPEGWEPFGIVPDDLYEAAYRKLGIENEASEPLGYVFEYRIPWTTLGAKRPFKGGDLMAGSVQMNWGHPDGVTHITIATVSYDVQVGNAFPYQQCSCWGKVIFSETGNIPKDLVEEGVIPPKPTPLTFEYDIPKDGEVCVVLFNEANEAVRILTASSPRVAGRAIDAWDGMDVNGNPLPAGTYTWKGIVRDPLTIKVRMSVHNSGRPGWLTDDTSSSWGGDHWSPTDVCAAPNGTLLLAWGDAEAGSGLIRTDMDGKKIWGIKATGNFVVANSERFFLSGHPMYTKETVRSYDLADGRPLNFGNGKPEAAWPEGAEGSRVSGLACAEGMLYVAYGASGVIGAYDAVSGDLQRTTKVNGTLGRIAWDAHGKRLLAVARLKTEYQKDLKTEDLKTEGGAWSIVALSSPPSGLQPSSLQSLSLQSLGLQSSGLQSLGLQSLGLQSLGLQSVVEGRLGGTPSPYLDAPTGIVVDRDGNIYVANQGALQNISVFNAGGTYLGGIGKEGGRPARGMYDPDGMYMPGGIAVAEDGRLWVAETMDSPRRHSVWKKTEGLKTEDLKGGGREWGFDKEFFGGCEYNGWVWMDTSDPAHVYCHNTKWAIDIDAGTWKPVSTIWRATEPNEVEATNPNGYSGHLRVVKANNGRRYAYGAAHGGMKVYREEGDVFKPFAGCISIFRAGSPHPGGSNFPVLYNDPENFPDDFYVWQDKNNDQLVQPNEVAMTHGGVRGWFAWLDRDLNLWSYGYKIPPTHVDENGQPHYDFNVRIPTVPTPPWAAIWMSDDETDLYVYARAGHNGFVARMDRETKAPIWAYRNLVEWHYSLGFPIVRPGMLHGLTMPLGVAGEFTGLVSYFGPYHLFTTDGIYVGMVMRDSRDGKGFGEDTHACECEQGQIVKLTMPRASSAGVRSQESGVQNEDRVDRYFLLGGANDGRITEIFGLDTVERLSGGTYVHTQEMADKAVKARQEYDLMVAKGSKLDIQRGRAVLDTATSIERVVDDKRRFAVQTAYDAQNLYFRYDVQNDIGLVNSSPDPVFIFKGGNCIDIQILKTEDQKTEDQKGDPRRLLVTRQEGRPLAMLYHTVVPEGAEPIMFYSSSGKGALGAIADVTDRIALEYREQPGGFVAVLTVPQELFGLSLKPRQELAMDVGYVFGNREGNQVMARAYWSNNGFAANVVNDIPSEILMVPEEWGKAAVE